MYMKEMEVYSMKKLLKSVMAVMMSLAMAVCLLATEA